MKSLIYAKTKSPHCSLLVKIIFGLAYIGKERDQKLLGIQEGFYMDLYLLISI